VGYPVEVLEGPGVVEDEPAEPLPVQPAAGDRALEAGPYFLKQLGIVF